MVLQLLRGATPPSRSSQTSLFHSNNNNKVRGWNAVSYMHFNKKNMQQVGVDILHMLTWNQFDFLHLRKLLRLGNAWIFFKDECISAHFFPPWFFVRNMNNVLGRRRSGLECIGWKFAKMCGWLRRRSSTSGTTTVIKPKSCCIPPQILTHCMDQWWW